MKSLNNSLRARVWITAFGVLIVVGSVLLSGCAAFQPKAQGSRTPTAVQAARDIGTVRIDAPRVIDAADAAGCDLGVVMYSEGKRESKIGIYCDGGMKMPAPR